MIKDRLAKTRKVLKKQTLDALLISSPANITYLTGYSNFSKDEREAFLLITNDQQCILTDGRYSEAVSSTVPNWKLIEVSTRISFKKILRALAKKLQIHRIGFEENNVTFWEYTMLSSCFNDLNHDSSVEKLRMVKDREEITAIQNASALGDRAFVSVLKKIREGITEKQIALELEWFIKKHSADISFPPIVAFGENSSIPHHQTSDQRLASSGQFVLLDFGVKVNNYCSDMTRTVFFGRASNKQREMYNTVLAAQQKAIDYLERLTSDGGSPELLESERPRSRRPAEGHDSSEVYARGINARDIDRVAREYIESQGYPTIPHSVGHGIGLEVHEAPSLSPRSKDKLVPGMVFSVEPGIYIEGFGGVRIEDLVVLERTGSRILTNSPKHLIEL